MKTSAPVLFACILIGITGCHHHSSARRSRMPAPVIGVETPPAPAPAAVVTASNLPPTATDADAAKAQRTIGANDADDYYLSLMTPEEIDILRARASESGRTSYQLTDFLTPAERDNLRRRDPGHR